MSIEDPNTGPGRNAGTGSSDLKGQATNDLNKAAGQAKHDLDEVRKRAEEDARQLKEQASAKVGEATESAKSFASDQKNYAAGQMNSAAEAIRKVADEMNEPEQQTVARYARDIASGLSRMGKTVENRDVDDLMGMAQDFGRKQPVAFLGAAALAGFAASRFALASAHRREKRYGVGNTGAARTATTRTSTVGTTATGTVSSTTFSPTTSTSTYRPGQTGRTPTGGQ
jgi:vacuolar-type H+-ATPase subunit H